MLVSPVSNVSVNNYKNNVQFGNLGDGEKLKDLPREPKRASNLVKVPVIVMMTLSPSLLNGTTPAASEYEDNFPQTELLAMASPEPQSRTSSVSRRSSYVKPQIVQYQESFSSNGVQYTMYWVDPVKTEDKNSNYVKEIYFVPKGYQPQGNSGRTGNDDTVPPQLAGIVYHDLGKNEFVGALVKERKANYNWYQKEIRLPDDIANKLMDLVKGRTKFQIVKGQAIDKMFKGENMKLATSPELIKEHYVN